MTRRQVLQHGAALALAAPGALLLTGCPSGSSQTVTDVIRNLQAALDVIDGALPTVLGLTTIPEALQVAIVQYMDATNEALGQAILIWNGAGTLGSKTASILAAFAAIARPAVPDQYKNVVAIIEAIANVVGRFLTSLPAPAAAAVAPAARTAFLPPSKKPASDASPKLSKEQAAALARAREKYSAIALKLATTKR